MRCSQCYARRALVVTIALVLAASVDASGAGAATRYQVGEAAAAYAASKGYHVGIAVYDTKTGEVRGWGHYAGTFASESVVKVFIATRLLVRGVMTGTTERRAYKMITQSDDAMASLLYSSVGGDGLITWVKNHYDVPDLGSPPRRANWWGNTHITPIGLVKLYAKLKRDSRVGPWLLNAMHHATKYGSDGQYQFFGLPSATTAPAVKQGWGDDYDDWSRSADFNTTGYVDGDRYAVAILARGPISTYGSAIGGMLTHAARLLLPGGQYPAPYPVISKMSRHAGALAGGTLVTVYGASFTHVGSVLFGTVPATFDVISSGELRVRVPRHGAAAVHVHVVTDHGQTQSDLHSAYTYVAPPTITAISPAQGPAAGGARVTLTGTDFRSVSRVLFGTTRGTSVTVTSSGSLTVTAPPSAIGTVDIRVVTAYGSSPAVAADRYAYG